MTLCVRLCVLLGCFCVSACTPEFKKIVTAEIDAVKTYNYGENFKKLTGFSDVERAAPEPTFTENLNAEYCTGAKWADGRRLLVSGISEDTIAYGGCILEAPVPYDPLRLQGRP